jgi:uncharacterized RDD family membrane protein YckC
LSERVGNYRKRRARLQAHATARENLELDFDESEELAGHRSIDIPVTREDEDSGFDMEIGRSAGGREESGQLDGPLAFAPPGDEEMQLDAPPAKGEEVALGEHAESDSPMEILVGSPTEAEYEDHDADDGIFLAQIGRRFLAGLTDAAVLVLGAAVFGVIVWRVCGSLSLVPLNLAVLGALAVILIFAYFAVFTAIAAATPGLLWMGCEIRNLRGEHPTVTESTWRAFGVLVSLSALMLGFIWACVDSDSLTWHDRMSGTVITEEHRAGDLSSAKAET